MAARYPPSTISTLIGGTSVPVGRLEGVFLIFSPRALVFLSALTRASGALGELPALAVATAPAFAADSAGPDKLGDILLTVGLGAIVVCLCKAGLGDVDGRGEEGCEWGFCAPAAASGAALSARLSTRARPISVCCAKLPLEELPSSLGKFDEAGEGTSAGRAGSSCIGSDSARSGLTDSAVCAASGFGMSGVGVVPPGGELSARLRTPVA